MKKTNVISVLLIGLVTILMVFGLVMLYSTTAAKSGEHLLKRQALWMLVGIVAMLLVQRVDYRLIGSFSLPALVLICLPLFYLFIAHVLVKLHPFGLTESHVSSLPFLSRGAVKGTYRWLTIGNCTVQPSEFAKLAIILFLARYFGTSPRCTESFKYGVLHPLLIVGVVLFLVLAGGSLSVSFITGCVVLGMLFVAGVRLRYITMLVLLATVTVAVVLGVSDNRRRRLLSYLHPEDDPQGSSYQLTHSQLALGVGSWQGVGFNQSLMKADYLPESHTDFIMAIVGEELGFSTMALVLLLYLLFVAMSFYVSSIAVDREGMLLAFGVGLSVGLHAWMNLSVVSGLVPTTGVTAPLISYGGSSIVMTWICIGLLLSIVRVMQMEEGRGLRRRAYVGPVAV